jgi:hypothetical protein
VTKKRGNPNWGKPDLNHATSAACSFEEMVKKLRLSPQEYGASAQLKAWAQKNKDHKYVPSNLLEMWGLQVRVD